jgi:hypothetical protein
MAKTKTNAVSTMVIMATERVFLKGGITPQKGWQRRDLVRFKQSV